MEDIFTPFSKLDIQKTLNKPPDQHPYTYHHNISVCFYVSFFFLIGILMLAG